MIYMELTKCQFMDIMIKNGFSFNGSELLFQIVSDFEGDYHLDPAELREGFRELSIDDAAIEAGFWKNHRGEFVKNGVIASDPMNEICKALELENWGSCWGTWSSDNVFILAR